MLLKEEYKKGEKKFRLSFMLPSLYRIRKKKDFENILKRGHTIIGRFFIIKIIDNKKETQSRFAFVFPIRLEKRACKRNRIRRIFREAIRVNLSKIKDAVDIIFIIKEEAKNKGYIEIKEEIEKSFKKNKLFKK